MPDTELHFVGDDGSLVPVAEVADIDLSKLSHGPVTIEGRFTLTHAGDALMRELAGPPQRNTFKVEYADGTVHQGQGTLTGVPMVKAGEVTYECSVAGDLGTWTHSRPSTAALRRELRDRSATRRRKGKVWAWLLYRRHHRC